MKTPLPRALAAAVSLVFALPFVLRAAEPPRVVPKQRPSWFPAQLFGPDEPLAEDFDEYTFGVTGKPDVTVRGRYWESGLPPKDPEQWRAQGLARWKREGEQQLAAAGFKNVFRHEDEFHLEQTFQKGQGESATYLRVTLDARDPSRNVMRAVEAAANPLVVEAPPPAATPEKVTDTSGYPYLPPPNHAKLIRTVHEDGPMHFFMAQTGPATLVGSGAAEKEYESDRTVSAIAFHDAYAAALKKAGWTISRDNAGQGFLYARYDRNGRDIYVYLVRTQGRPFSFEVADTGTELESQLARDCKAALYGIEFDFDKATIRPDSEPVLQQILALMKKEPRLAVEIGGHTDNVGKPDYNLALSGKRAAAVSQWLVAHGVAASRLSSHGYGDTQPVLPNTSDDNRARNRRVELKKAGCK